MYKRIVALILTATLLLGVFPLTALADSKQAHSTVDAGDVTVQGTNSFGTLLSEDIADAETATEEEAASYGGGYSVTDLEIAGSTATITYDSMEDVILIVALYSEDGMQMLLSAETLVPAEETVATVTFDGDMPQYFLASAYLVDTYDLSPLCPAYDTPMYTQEMQELLASTVADYDEALVLNLDEDETTNFAVYQETTKIIEYAEGVNTVASVNDDTDTYVIENADEQFTTLIVGDVFAYEYDENEILIVKVASITVDSTTVTITGDDIEMGEAFSIVKIEGEGGTGSVTVDDSCTSSGISLTDNTETYLINADQLAGIGLCSDEENPSISKEIALGFDLGKGEEFGYNGFTVTGRLDLVIKVDFSYYHTKNYHRVRSTVKSEIDLSAEVIVTLEDGAELTGVLGFFTFPVVPGISMEFTPEFVVHANFSASVTLSFSEMVGFEIEYAEETGWSSRLLHERPRPELKTEFEGTLFIGLVFRPSLEALEGLLLDMEVEAMIGVELTAVLTTSTDITESSKHTCTGCLDGDLSFIVRMKPMIMLLKNKNLKFETTLMDTTIQIGNCYLSLDNMDFGIGKCPNYAYLFTIQIMDGSNVPIPGAMVNAANKEYTANNDGVVSAYIPSGYNWILASDGIYSRTVTVFADDARKLTIILSAETDDEDSSGNSGESGDWWDDIDFSGVLDRFDIGEIIDHGAVIASGNCGADGDNVKWVLYSDGFLHIYGKGDMESFYPHTAIPWYDYHTLIRTVKVDEDVTLISRFSFYDCENLLAVDMSDSVTYIGGSAFVNCSNLSSIVLSDNLAAIRHYTFDGCASLARIYIPQSVSNIGVTAFAECNALSTVYYGGSEEEWSSIEIEGGNDHLIRAIILYNSFPSDMPNDYIAIFSSEESLISEQETVRGETVSEIAADTAQTAGGALAVDRIDGDETEDTTNPDAVYGGDYTTEVTDSYTLKTASFTGLVPGQQYVLLAMVSTEVENPLAPDNLLYIDQAEPLEDGTLSFQYVQRVSTDISYVVACGASNKDLADAEITFPEMESDIQNQVVSPTVVYDGVTLTEGQDYVVVGTVSFTEEGTYTCYIRGIRNYTGIVECSYTVAEAPMIVAGTSLSLNGDIGVNFYTILREDVIADENTRMVFNVGGTAQEMALVDALTDTQDDGSIWYRFSYSVPAKGMADEITAQLYGTDGSIGEVMTYSVAAYYDDICQEFDREEKTVLFDLIESMLNYGAASQEYFSCNTETLANAAVTTAVPETVDASAFANAVTDTDKLLDYAGTSLVLDTTTTLRVFFRAVNGTDLSNYTFTVNGETVTAVQRGSLWYIELTNIAAKDLDTAYTFAAGDVTVECSALSYVNNVLNKADTLDAKLVAVCKALYAYNEAANIYFE